VRAALTAANGRFVALRLSTQNPSAARLYEALGFRRLAGDARCTHVMELRGSR
jgi:predicted GNAT family acetyltransferase